MTRQIAAILPTGSSSQPLSHHDDCPQALELASENTAAAQLAGDLFRDGIGGPADGVEAERLYRLAAEAGRDTAWLRLGALLGARESIVRDPEGALDAFERAAAGSHEDSAARAQIALLRGHARGEFGTRSDLSRISDLASQPLRAGNVDAARIIVSSAADKVPAGTLLTALDILNTAAKDENDGAARELFSYWRAQLNTRPDIAREEMNRIVAEYAAMLPENTVLLTRIGLLAPTARDASQYEKLSGLLMNASSDTLPAALVALRRQNANAYVYALQSLLEKHSFYSGPKNGLLTTSTIMGIGRLCASAGISQECALGPLRGPVAHSIGTAFTKLPEPREPD